MTLTSASGRAWQQNRVAARWRANASAPERGTFVTCLRQIERSQPSWAGFEAFDPTDDHDEGRDGGDEQAADKRLGICCGPPPRVAVVLLLGEACVPAEKGPPIPRRSYLGRPDTCNEGRHIRSAQPVPAGKFIENRRLGDVETTRNQLIGGASQSRPHELLGSLRVDAEHASQVGRADQPRRLRQFCPLDPLHSEDTTHPRRLTLPRDEVESRLFASMMGSLREEHMKWLSP